MVSNFCARDARRSEAGRGAATKFALTLLAAGIAFADECSDALAKLSKALKDKAPAEARQSAESNALLLRRFGGASH